MACHGEVAKMETVSAANDASRDAFLVAEDDEAVASMITRLLRPLGEVIVAADLAEALDAAVVERHWTALFVEWRLPGGNGLEVVAACRRRQGHVPALVFTGDVSEEVANLACDLDAVLAVKPVDEARLTDFARRAAARGAAGAAPVNELVRAWDDRYRFTSAQSFILRSLLCGTPRRDLARVLRIAPGTLKSHVYGLVQKTGETSLEAVVIKAQREIIDRAYESIPLGI
jgi:DNA-binding NarL/FixJ family response regulator